MLKKITINEKQLKICGIILFIISTIIYFLLSNHVKVLYVYYDEQIKKVYRVKAVINNISEELADQKYQMIQQLLQRKYEDCYFQEDKKENKPSLTIYASRDLCKTLSLEICLYHYFFVPL